MTGLRGLGLAICDYTDGFCKKLRKSSRQMVLHSRTVLQEDLTLTLRSGRIGIGVWLPQLKTAFHINFASFP